MQKLMLDFRVLIKCLQPAKKPATGRFEPSTFWEKNGLSEGESLKLSLMSRNARNGKTDGKKSPEGWRF